jgi:hypothetical protein
LPTDGRNHKLTHRIEFNKRMGRWICGCGWKSESTGREQPRERRHKERTETRDPNDEVLSLFGGSEPTCSLFHRRVKMD